MITQLDGESSLAKLSQLMASPGVCKDAVFSVVRATHSLNEPLSTADLTYVEGLVNLLEDDIRDHERFPFLSKDNLCS